jgi:hypothetical protein
MQLWQIDIVGSVFLTSGVEVKVVTAVDDHSRFCVSAKVVRRATGRAVCLAFAEAMTRYGVPEEVLSDNGKQFTDRFGKGGEVLFDRICRDNGITHRLTPPRTPTTTGKVERFHGSLRRELLDHCGPFESLEAAQAAIDAWVVQYNTRRPHQSLDMCRPAERFLTTAAKDKAEQGEQLLPLTLPATLSQALAATGTPEMAAAAVEPSRQDTIVPGQRWAGDAVEFERVVPASGNMSVAGKQFWLGPARAGVVVTFWADTDVVHLLIAGVRVKSFRSHLSVNDLYARAGVDLAAAKLVGVGSVCRRQSTDQVGQILSALHRAGVRRCTASGSKPLAFPVTTTCLPRPTPWPGAPKPAANRRCPAALFTSTAPIAPATPCDGESGFWPPPPQTLASRRCSTGGTRHDRTGHNGPRRPDPCPHHQTGLRRLAQACETSRRLRAADPAVRGHVPGEEEQSDRRLVHPV